MANVRVMFIFGVFLAIVHSQAQSFLDSSTTTYYDSVSENLPVFQKGKFEVKKPIEIKKSKYSAPEPLLILSPKKAGVYPVLFFIHGTMLPNGDYSELLNFIASHGFVVVAPQLCSWFYLPSQEEEIRMAAEVTNWLPSNLQKVLQNKAAGVEGDLDKLAISGHSRGGKSAFALALGISKPKLTVKISALIGVDPVAGPNSDQETEPYILTNSFNLSVPVTVIGTGLGNKSFIVPPCAPNNVNHQGFFNKCKKGSHFVITKYGHMQMLNDFSLNPVTIVMSVVCEHSVRPPYDQDTMRRTLGGIMVAFLNNYFRHDRGQYNAILANPSLAPTKLFAEKKGNFGFAPTYAQA